MKKREIVLIAIIIFLAIVSRFIFLDYRVLHHDEGVNYFFADGILENGRFIYDPLNYHGPLYFFAIALSFILFGVSEISLRLPAVIFGVLIILFSLFFRRKEFGYIPSILLLFSPSLMYYSRYSIHESAFVFFSLISIYLFSLILEKKNLKYLPYFAAFLAFIFALKETSIIMLFVFFVLSIIHYKKILSLSWKKNFNIVIISCFVFLIIYILFFSSFFMNLRGISDSLNGYLPWADRGLNEKGHDKPFYYYGSLLIDYELPILIFALIGIYYCYRNRKSIFAVNFLLWMILSFLIYSLIPYKTPWLLINIVTPICFIAGFAVQSMKFKYKWIFVAAGILYLGLTCLYVNFGYPWQSVNDFAYVHTDIDIIRLGDKIKENSENKILIVSKEYWPLPFYLHGKNVSYFPGLDNYENYTDYLIIFEAKDFEQRRLIGYNYEKYKLREGVELILMKEFRV